MKKRGILLVEDNLKDEARAMRAFEANRIKDEVVVARDGQEAIDYLFGIGRHAGRDPYELPQLVLLKPSLPLLDGLDVLRLLRANPCTRRAPVVMWSSSSNDQEVVRGYSLGANSCIRKPVDFEPLVEVVRQICLYWMLLNEGSLHGERSPVAASLSAGLVQDTQSEIQPIGRTTPDAYAGGMFRFDAERTPAGHVSA